MKLEIDRHSDVPIYRQIVQQVHQKISSGELAAGVKLPSVRVLSRGLKVSAVTVHHAYQELARLRLLDLRARSAVRVAARFPAVTGRQILNRLTERGPDAGYELMAEDAGIRSMASSVADPALFRHEDFVAELQDLRNGSPWNFYYSEPAGTPELLQAIASILSKQGDHRNEESLVVTHGSLGGLSVVLESLSEPGDVVLVQEPGRLWLKELFASKGVVGVPVELPDEGVCAAELVGLAKETKAKFLYVSPDFGHCTGRMMSRHGREQCALAAEMANLTVLEDAACSALNFEGAVLPPLSALATERTVHVGSFSYSICPGLRIGYLALPQKFRLAVRRAIDSSFVSGSRFVQRALAHYISNGAYEGHLRRVLPRYRARRDALMLALERHMPAGVTWSHPLGGFSSWVQAGDMVVSSRLYEQAIKRGVAFAPGNLFIASGNPESQFRLSFGLLQPEAIEASVATICELMSRRDLCG